MCRVYYAVFYLITHYVNSFEYEDAKDGFFVMSNAIVKGIEMVMLSCSVHAYMAFQERLSLYG